jgi:hypothetical protein
MPVRYHTGFETSDVVPPQFLVAAGTLSEPMAQVIATDHAHSGDRSFKVTLTTNDNWAFAGKTSSEGNMFARDTADDPIVVGCAIRVSDLTSLDMVSFGLASQTSGSTLNHIFLHIEEDGSATLRGHSADANTGGAPSGTQLGDGLVAGTFVSGAWYYIEIRIGSIHDTTGTVQLWVNGVLHVDFTGDTRYASNGTTGGIGYTPTVMMSTPASGGSMPVDVWVDDFYCGDDMAVLGPVYHEALVPTSTVEADGLGSDGNSVDNHLLIDDLLGAGSDYVDLDPADRGRYAFGDRTLTGAVLAVTLHGSVSNPDPGVVDANGFVLSGATEADGTAMVLSSATSTVPLVGPLETDPDTGEAWTTGGVNAITAGVEVVA